VKEKEIIKEFLEYQKEPQISSPFTKPADFEGLRTELTKRFEI